MVRIAINGLGRIGRCIFRAVFEEKISGIEIVCVNGPAEISQHVHLLKYDSIHGVFPGDISHDHSNIIVNGKKIPLLQTKEISKIDWSKYEVDCVMECTGQFTETQKLAMHIKSGAKKVILSAPAKTDDIKTIIFKVNNEVLTKNDNIISVGSCTTNCLAPIVKVLHESFGIEKGFMTTIHSYTGDQNNIDGSHRSDLRRARACALSMIPTSTGAAKTIGLVLPDLNGKLDGSAIRVPTPNVSVVDLVVQTKKNVTVEEVISSVTNASKGIMSGVLGITHTPLVSIDFNKTKESSILDATETKIVQKNMIRVLSWYDNEWAFAIRMIDIAKLWFSL